MLVGRSTLAANAVSRSSSRHTKNGIRLRNFECGRVRFCTHIVFQRAGIVTSPSFVCTYIYIYIYVRVDVFIQYPPDIDQTTSRPAIHVGKRTHTLITGRSMIRQGNIVLNDVCMCILFVTNHMEHSKNHRQPVPHSSDDDDL